MSELFGYAGKLLRIDLTHSKVAVEGLPEDKLRKYIGGATLGIRHLSDEVPPDVSELLSPEMSMVGLYQKH